jgi:hypothetical protein
MMHTYHDDLPGYDSAQLLHDGCDECETRASREGHGLAQLDTPNFRRAWARAAEWGTHGLPNISRAERPLLDMLWMVQVQFERIGTPIGVLPS